MPTDVIRWTRAEWHAVLVRAVPLAARTNRLLYQAMAEAQDVLSEGRRREVDQIRFSVQRGKHARYLDELNAMTHVERDALLPEGERSDPSAPEPIRTYKFKHASPEVRAMRATYTGREWTSSDWARIAKRVDERRAAGDSRNEDIVVIDAQDEVLPQDRRRKGHGIRKAFMRNISAWTEHMRKGRADAWTLSEPTPESTAADLSTRSAIEFVEAQLDAEPALVIHTNGQDRTAELARAFEFHPAGVQRSPVAVQFAESMAGLVDQLLAEQRRSVLAELAERIPQQVAEIVTRDLQAMLTATVHRLIEAELGPVAAPPAAVQPQSKQTVPSMSPPAAPARPKRIPIDVVGLSGHPVTEVQDALDSLDSIDLRFVPPEKVPSTHLRANVIAVTKFVGHDVYARAKKHGATVTRVNGAAETVIAAVRQLVEQQHVEAAPVH